MRPAPASRSSNPSRGLLLIHLAVFLFGFAGLFGKFIDCSPLYIVFGRTLFGAMALFAYAKLIAKTRLSAFNFKDLSFFILQGILLAAHWLTFFISIQVSSVAVGLVTFSSFPLFVTFMEPLFFKERIKKADVITAIAVFSGIILVVPDIDLANQVTLGSIYGILSGFTFAVLGLVNRRNAALASPIAVAYFQNLFAALFLIIPILFVTPPLPALNELPQLIVLGVIFTALAHTWFISGLTFVRVQTASVIAGMEPVYGIVFAFLLLNEIPTLSTLGGGTLIIGTTIAAGILSRTQARKSA